MPQRGQNIRRMGRIKEQTRYTTFYMKQHVHMIAPAKKEIKPTCRTCDGSGQDKFQQPCQACEGKGTNTFTISLYEYVGVAEISGSQLTADGKQYSVRYFDLSYVPEMVRKEESERRWRDVDNGRRPMSEAAWCTRVPDSCLYSSFSIACDVAYENNLDILQGFTKEEALAVMKLFGNADFDDEFDNPNVTDNSGPRKDPAFCSMIPMELMGDYPMLNYEDYNKSLNDHLKVTTESEFRKLHADIKIEPVLT